MVQVKGKVTSFLFIDVESIKQENEEFGRLALEKIEKIN